MPTSQSLPKGPLLCISPHLDDAVFSCGRLLYSNSDTRVVTVFAADPPERIKLTPWDKDCGFESSADAMKVRRDEDRNALTILGTEPRWLNFPDSQYCDDSNRPKPNDIAHALVSEIEAWQPENTLFPLGLFHSDHELVHSAALILLQETTHLGCQWIVYADALYRAIPELLEKRLSALQGRGFKPEPIWFSEKSEAPNKKAQAVACYGSQLRALETPNRPGSQDLTRQETYWQLSR